MGAGNRWVEVPPFKIRRQAARAPPAHCSLILIVVHAAGDSVEAVQSLSRANGAKRRLFGSLSGGNDEQPACQTWAPPLPAARAPGPRQPHLVLTGATLLAMLALSAIGSRHTSGLAGGEGGRHRSRRFLLGGGQQAEQALFTGDRRSADAPAKEPIAAEDVQQDAVWNVTALLATSGPHAAEMAAAAAAQQAFLRSLLPAASDAAGRRAGETSRLSIRTIHLLGALGLTLGPLARVSVHLCRLGGSGSCSAAGASQRQRRRHRHQPAAAQARGPPAGGGPGRRSSAADGRRDRWRASNSPAGIPSRMQR